MRRGPTIVRALEYGRVALPDPWNTAAVRERLEQAALRGGFKAFETRGRQLYARGVVGVVDLGGLIVEILPKTHDDNPPGEASIFLSDLLRFGGLLDRLAVLRAKTAPGELTIVEIILAWAVREAAANLREGLPRRYQVREEVSSAVRGRIEMRHLARRAPGKDFELYVRHAPLSEDNPLSGIIKWLIAQVSVRTRQAPTRRMARSLLHEMDHVRWVTPQRGDIARLVLQPTEARWKPLLELADMLLRQVSPDPGRAGAHDAVAVLFTLHDLFERVLRRIFRDGLGAHGLGLKRPGHMLLEHASGRMMPLRPDFLFGPLKGGPSAVGDAKWKRILDGADGFALSESDAYQLTTYLATHQAKTGLVFCPLARPAEDGSIMVRDFTVSGLGASLYVTGVHLPTLIDAGPSGQAARLNLCTHIAARITANVAPLAA
ncbi:McrC family protein [Caulobacter endophyticus]|uniref:5-methylcytosine-specific restriction enzyme subunit McrC n=1 Tax=Caulobacter endophyticus TaxID=2172652 RepID=A0A2T9KCG0_9CAUL|nr:hypothetical protein [Caulobacter endophyticus]PVM93638.1 hypothetical protein DDF67_02830 [Caulobacter endophyticus]